MFLGRHWKSFSLQRKELPEHLIDFGCLLPDSSHSLDHIHGEKMFKNNRKREHKILFMVFLLEFFVSFSSSYVLSRHIQDLYTHFIAYKLRNERFRNEGHYLWIVGS